MKPRYAAAALPEAAMAAASTFCLILGGKLAAAAEAEALKADPPPLSELLKDSREESPPVLRER